MKTLLILFPYKFTGFEYFRFELSSNLLGLTIEYASGSFNSDWWWSKTNTSIFYNIYSLECEKIDREKSVGHLVKAAIDMGAEAVDEQSMKAILEGEDGKSE